ncbi:nuclear transport factor 2 [Nematostella vectensis]|uniref:nuclear transport factor 2 n=1 Tax=Nematostella vectensis TaxID=45351 RepID=UPI0013900B1B|nr:nuclear transport factor 2 [Nematostella vectensis]
MSQPFEQVAKQFVEYYYSVFDSNRNNLAPLYQPGSMLTFEGAQIQGTEAIVAKLVSMPFQQVLHVITSQDAQPLPNGGIIVFVMGQLKADQDPPLTFSQCFTLFQTTEGSYYVQNDMFRLGLHNG